MMQWNGERIRERAWSILLGTISLVLIGLVFYLGARSERSGFIREVIDPEFRRLSDPVLNAFRGRPPAVARLSLTMGPEALDSLEARSLRAFRDRHVDPADNQAVPTQVVYGDQEYAAQVVLRDGALLVGLPRQWPLQVRTSFGDTIQDLQTFDLFPINDEAPLWSMVLQAVLADQGLTAMGSGIAEVAINGRDQGLCALFGRADATMLAQWSRGSGPVLRFDDGLYVNANMAMAERSFPSTSPPQGDWLSAPLLVQDAAGDLHANRARKATRRMEAFRSGGLAASEVFAAHDLAKTMALCDLLGMAAAMDWWNLRFLVDSTTEQLIAIPQHSTVHAPIGAVMAEEATTTGPHRTGREVVNKALSDPRIHDLYIAYLDSFSVDGWWEVMRERTRPQWEHARSVVNAEKPRLDLDFTVVEHDRRVIRQALYPKDIALAYVNDTLTATDGVVIANVHALSIQVVGVVLSTGDTTLFSAPLNLPPRARDQPLRYTYIPLNVPGSPREVLLRLGSTLRSRSVRIRTWTSFGAN